MGTIIRGYIGLGFRVGKRMGTIIRGYVGLGCKLGKKNGNY